MLCCYTCAGMLLLLLLLFLFVVGWMVDVAGAGRWVVDVDDFLSFVLCIFLFYLIL